MAGIDKTHLNSTQQSTLKYLKQHADGGKVNLAIDTDEDIVVFDMYEDGAFMSGMLDVDGFVHWN